MPTLVQDSLFDMPPSFRVPRRWMVTCARELRALCARRKRLTPLNEPEWGVTADDIRAIAQRLGYSAPGAKDRRDSWYAAVPKIARLRNSGRRRPGHSRNSHTVWVL